jgi:RNA recognition motif-containing protein
VTNQTHPAGERPAFDDPTRDVYVSGLPFRFELDEDLIELAGQYGPVLRARIVRFRASHKSQGFGFVRYETAEGAQRGRRALDGLMFEGRVLEARPANPVRSRGPTPEVSTRREKSQ